MDYGNVKLWFAKDDQGKIVTIDEVTENNAYSCPICGSSLKPKAIGSKRIASHFAHVDASKCNSETMIHWWFKHKFLEKGDKFTITSDRETSYICKSVIPEQSYQIENRTYKPDVTIFTECGEVIYFEMAFTNKKSVKDYLDSWIELGNIVVEIDVKDLMFKKEIPKFKALFYEGKCFNIKRNDTYYNTIGKYKEEKLSGRVNNKLKESICKLDWFWNDMLRYKSGEINSEELAESVKYVDIKEKNIVYDIIKKLKCSELEGLCKILKEEVNSYKTTHRFYYSPLSKESEIKKAVIELNNFFKNINTEYRVILNSNSVKRKAYKYRNFRKIGYWKVEYYYYSVDLHYKTTDYLHQINVTTYIKNLNDVNLIYNYFLEIFAEYVNNAEAKKLNN